jgi:S-adenosylmethionine-diacylgycerolhomoserine-N-methlytransferase
VNTDDKHSNGISVRAAAAFEKMDRMYRFQRYFYDATRKYYLLGRDRLLNQMNVLPGQTILEIGCGTGRNLAILAKRHPKASFFGLDASMAMLEMADARLNSSGANNVSLAQALAQEFYYRDSLDLTDRLDRIFFSYSISMIPEWAESIDNALNNLKPGGELSILDFYDQRELPAVFQAVLRNWLAAFQVRYPADLLSYMNMLQTQGLGRLTVTSLYRRYAFIAKFQKS